MLSTHSYSLLCNIIYIFKIDCNFFSTLGAAGGLFFRLNRPTAAAKRVYSTTHTWKHNLLLPVSPWSSSQWGLCSNNCEQPSGSEKCHSLIPGASSAPIQSVLNCMTHPETQNESPGFMAKNTNSLPAPPVGVIEVLS